MKLASRTCAEEIVWEETVWKELCGRTTDEMQQLASSAECYSGCSSAGRQEIRTIIVEFMCVHLRQMQQQLSSFRQCIERMQQQHFRLLNPILGGCS